MTRTVHDEARPTRRTKKTEETRRRILDASVELFMEQGYEKTTTRQILQRVGILNGSLYNIYRSKEEIFSDIILTALDDVIRQSSEYLPQDSSAAMRLSFLLNVEISLSGRSHRVAELLRIAHEKWDIHVRVTERTMEWLSDAEGPDVWTEEFRLRLDACNAVSGVFIERICHDPDSVDVRTAMSVNTDAVMSILGAEDRRDDVMSMMDVISDNGFEICGVSI